MASAGTVKAPVRPRLYGRAAGTLSRRPSGLLATSSLVALVMLVPLAFLITEAVGTGGGRFAALVFRQFTATLLWNTVRLAAVVAVLCAVIGTGAAFLTERTDLPFRRAFSVLLVIPLAVPDFVVSFGWASLTTAVSGFKGAILVMTLAIYPLVYLPVASSLRNADPALEEVARSLGHGRLRTFFGVTIGQARHAILGGSLLVVLVLLAEYGAFEILGYQTFTTEIFAEFSNFEVPTACALSLVLVVIGLVVVTGESFASSKRRVARVDRLAQRETGRHRLGRLRLPAVAVLVALVGLALGVPVGSAAYWWAAGPTDVLQGVSLLSATGYTAAYSAAAAAVATLLAVPVAVMAIRHDSPVRRLIERSTYLVLAMPGLVIALALGTFSERYAGGLWYQTAPMLVGAYAVMFFPLALVGVRASVAQAPVGLEEVARSLGVRRVAVAWRVTRPLVVPGLTAAFCLVFLSAVTELTATLILVPTGVETLATQFWAYQQNIAYGQAAPFALLMIALAAVPSAVLGRYFDRLPQRAISR